VGDGSPSIEPGSGNKPAISVSGGGTAATVQGFKLQGALGGEDADGVRCQGASNPGTVVVVETTITDNKGQGIDAFNCTVTLHRNRIQSNQGGGVSLINGAFTVVNNVVALNGSAASALGGVKLDPGANGSVVFANDTVVENTASGAADAAGVTCAGMAGTTLVNVIVWGNLGSVAYKSCSFDHSDVEGGAIGGTKNLNVKPLLDPTTYAPATTPSPSPCIDQGTDTRSVTAIDLMNTDRLKGSGVDLGAYEVQ
jgi:hypothetical protein